MNYFLDTEFEEAGERLTLVSLAVVSEDEREFYAENDAVDVAALNPWLLANVVPHLAGPRMPQAEMARRLLEFMAGAQSPQFWGWFCAHDWVLFCRLFGGLVAMPRSLPGYCMDIRQEMTRRRLGSLDVPHIEPRHNALNDARWARELWRALRRAE